LNEVDTEVGSELFDRACDFLGLSVDDLDRLRTQVTSAVENADA
jgi:hypothetical protein